MLERFIARQAADLVEKTEPPRPETNWRVEFDVTVSGVCSDDETRVGYDSEVEAPDAETAIYFALLEIATLAVGEADQQAVMRRMGERIAEQFGAAGEGK